MGQMGPYPTVMPSSRYVDRIKVGAVRIALFAFNVVSLTGGLLALGRWSRARWFSAALVFLAIVDWSGEKLAWQLLAGWKTESVEV